MFIAFLLLPGGALNHNQNKNTLLMWFEKISKER